MAGIPKLKRPTFHNPLTVATKIMTARDKAFQKIHDEQHKEAQLKLKTRKKMKNKL